MLERGRMQGAAIVEHCDINYTSGSTDILNNAAKTMRIGGHEIQIQHVREGSKEEVFISSDGKVVHLGPDQMRVYGYMIAQGLGIPTISATIFCIENYTDGRQLYELIR